MTKNLDEIAASELAGMAEDLRKGLVPAKIFGSQEIYDLELRQIFAKSWVFVGHESEIPNPGDFVTRTIGEDPFIFVRDKNHKIQVLLNSCRHRGTQVCRVQAGNVESFSCPFHGWEYDTTGALKAVPARKQGYASLNFDDWGLFKAPHVANYHGLVFANLDKNAVTFEEYIGAFSWYLDIHLCLTEGGMEILGEPHRWVADANWKQGAEGFCGDSSHTQMTHRSALEIGVVNNIAAGAPRTDTGLHIHDCDGSAVSIRQLPGEKPFFLYPAEVQKHFRQGKLNKHQFELAERSLLQNGTIFPNFSFLHIGLSDSPKRDPAAFLTLRVWQPRGPRRMEIWNWILAPKEASPEYKRRAYQVGMSSFSPSGSFEQDDMSVWSGVARSASTVFAELNDVRYNYQMGLGDMSASSPLQHWVGPGIADTSNAGEGGLRTFHKTWYERMSGKTLEAEHHS